MDRLVTVRDVKDRYGCSLPTARKYIRQCNPHMENPLATYEWAFREWEQGRLVVIGSKRHVKQLLHQMSTGRVLVPRKRD